MRKFFAIILVITLWILIPTTLLLLGIRYVTFDPNTYKDALREENIYNQAIDLSPEIIDKYIKLDINNDEVKKIVVEIISESWLQGNVEKIIDNIFLMVTSNADPSKLETNIALSEVKNKININSNEIGGENITAITAEIPDQFNLYDLLKQNKLDNYVYNLRALWQTFNLIIIICCITVLLSLLTIILLLCYSLKNLLRWIGISFFVPAASLMPFLAIPKFLLRYYLTSIFITRFYLSIEMTTPLVELIYNIVNKFIMFILLPNIIIIFLGITLIILSFIIKNKQNVIK
jgi:hypothetical protein